MGQVSGKSVVLTGASQGLGVVMADMLAAEGADLLLAARSEDKLKAVALAMPPGSRVLIQVADVTSAADRSALLARATREFGSIDVLINNAGVEDLGIYAEQDPDVLRRIVETNLLSPM